MSISIAYFFNSDLTLPALGETLDRVLGCHLAPYESDPADLFCRLFSLETSLGEHTLEDDRELNFTAFRYQLDTRTPWGDADLRDIQLGLMATIPQLLYRRAGIAAGLLVQDVQKLLARYELRDNQFFDVVSGESVVFPSHLQIIYARANVV